MEHSNDSLGIQVDELLVECEEPMRERMTTGVYDSSFFDLHKAPMLNNSKPALLAMEDARVGLGLFMDEAQRALETSELTVDQRCHVATIISYVEGLAKRFDRVREPGFEHPKR